MAFYVAQGFSLRVYPMPARLPNAFQLTSAPEFWAFSML